MKIYIAGPLFSEAERDWIRKTIKQLENLARERGKEVTVIFPYDLAPQEELDRLGSRARFEVFSRCRFHIEDADVVIAILDGAQVDDGTAWELGYFYRDKPDGSRIIGLRTDFRVAGEGRNSVVNAMVECSCDKIVRTSEDLLREVEELM